MDLAQDVKDVRVKPKWGVPLEWESSAFALTLAQGSGRSTSVA